MGVLRRVREALATVGFRNALAALVYTGWRRRLDERYPAPDVGLTDDPGPGGRAGAGSPAPSWTGTGEAVRVRPLPDGIEADFARERLRLVFLAPDLVEVTWREPPFGLPVGWPGAQRGSGSSTAAAGAGKAAAPGVRVTEDARGWRLATQEMEVCLSRDGSLTFARPGGTVLRRDLPPAFRGTAVRHLTVLDPREHLYGLGERAATFDLRGGAYRLWNRDPAGYGPGDDPLYLSVPVYVSQGVDVGYLVFYACAHDAVFDLGRRVPDLAEHRLAGGGLRYYFVPGPLDRALDRYTELTGRPALPPLWVLGYHQSRWSYHPEARVRRLAADFARHDVPADGVFLDIHYMRGYRVFTVDEDRFPDLARLCRDLGRQGLKVVVILDPGVKRDPAYDVYREGMEKGYFVTLPDGTPVHAPVWPGWCAFPDFTRPEVREWWGGLYRRLLDRGVQGFWHDMNEPAVFVASGDPTLPRCARHALGEHGEVHNLYGLYMNRAAYEALRRLAPDRRPFLVSRSGWAGLQRYAAAWSGDVRSDWECLRQTVATTLGVGLSGIPFFGSDVGGFTGVPEPELYVRWLQLGAFTPFFRSHTCLGTPDQEPWSHGEPYLSVARTFIRLRYSLLPYIYTAAWQASRHGWPVARPLFWPKGEGKLLDAGDEFLLGDSLLVAPVLEPGAEGREVTLPAGRWYDFWSDAPLDGPGVARLETPLERLGLLVRAGTVLPREEPARSTAERHLERLFLHLYPPEPAGEGRSHLYSDSGDGYGPHRLDSFRLSWDGGRLRLDWEVGEGGYPWPYREVRLVIHGLRVARVTVDGREAGPAPEGVAAGPRPFRTALIEAGPRGAEGRSTCGREPDRGCPAG